MRMIQILCASSALLLFSNITNAHAQITSPQSQQLMQQLQGLLQKSGLNQVKAEAQQKKIAMGLAILQIRGCVEQNAGKTATKSFIDDVLKEGKIIEGLCKQGQATEARKQVIALLKAKEHDPAARAARLCYQDHQDAFSAINDKVSAEDLANYERWAEDPSLAQSEMKNSDICKNSVTQK